MKTAAILILITIQLFGADAGTGGSASSSGGAKSKGGTQGGKSTSGKPSQGKGGKGSQKPPMNASQASRTPHFHNHVHSLRNMNDAARLLSMDPFNQRFRENYTRSVEIKQRAEMQMNNFLSNFEVSVADQNQIQQLLAQEVAKDPAKRDFIRPTTVDSQVGEKRRGAGSPLAVREVGNHLLLSRPESNLMKSIEPVTNTAQNSSKNQTDSKTDDGDVIPKNDNRSSGYSVSLTPNTLAEEPLLFSLLGSEKTNAPVRDRMRGEEDRDENQEEDLSGEASENSTDERAGVDGSAIIDPFQISENSQPEEALTNREISSLSSDSSPSFSKKVVKRLKRAITALREKRAATLKNGDLAPLIGGGFLGLLILTAVLFILNRRLQTRVMRSPFQMVPVDASNGVTFRVKADQGDRGWSLFRVEPSGAEKFVAELGEGTVVRGSVLGQKSDKRFKLSPEGDWQNTLEPEQFILRIRSNDKAYRPSF